MTRAPPTERCVVSPHAILRWLERVEGIDMPAMRAAARRAGVDPTKESWFVKWLRRNAPADIDEVERRILCPDVLAALAIGASKVRIGAFVIVLDEQRVVTVKPTAKRRLRPPRYERRVPSSWVTVALQCDAGKILADIRRLTEEVVRNKAYRTRSRREGKSAEQSAFAAAVAHRGGRVYGKRADMVVSDEVIDERRPEGRDWFRRQYEQRWPTPGPAYIGIDMASASDSSAVVVRCGFCGRNHGVLANEKTPAICEGCKAPLGDKDRGTGRTTRQLRKLDNGGIFFCEPGLMHFVKRLAEDIGRGDIRVLSARGLPDALMGVVAASIDIDHDARSKMHPDSLREAERLIRGCQLAASDRAARTDLSAIVIRCDACGTSHPTCGRSTPLTCCEKCGASFKALERG